MKSKDFVDLGGIVIVTWHKLGYDVRAEYKNIPLFRTYVGTTSNKVNLNNAIQTAVNECMYSRANHLRAQQRYNINWGRDDSFPCDVFTGHPGLHVID